MNTPTTSDRHPKPTEKAGSDPGYSETDDLQAKAEWLLRKTDQAIDQAQTRITYNRTRATWIRMSTIALSGLGTILLGLQIAVLERWFNDIAFVLTALVTLVSSIEPFFNFRALWVEHERAKYRFHVLRDDIDFYLAGTDAETLSEERLQAFHERYRNIWANLSETWLEQRESDRYSI